MTKGNENRRYWDKLKNVPDDAKKPIAAGRLRGLTSINPTWQKEIMTEVFGPVGIGWMVRYERGENDIFPASGEVIINMDAYVKVRDGEGWSEEIHGFGTAKLLAKEKNGLYFDDEAVKKAATNALGNALQYWGTGAGVRYESAEDDKYAYMAPPQEYETAPFVNAPIGTAANKTDQITKEQAEHIEKLADTYGKKMSNMLSYINGIRARSGNEPAESIEQLTYGDYCILVEGFNGKSA